MNMNDSFRKKDISIKETAKPYYHASAWKAACLTWLSNYNKDRSVSPRVELIIFLRDFFPSLFHFFLLFKFLHFLPGTLPLSLHYISMIFYFLFAFFRLKGSSYRSMNLISIALIIKMTRFSLLKSKCYYNSF